MTQAVSLHDLVPTDDPVIVFREVSSLLAVICPDHNPSFLEQAFEDTSDLFHGDYPGYRPCNTFYHDLNHTLATALAMARLLHGAHLDGVLLTSEDLDLGVLTALLHDTGLIQTNEDTEGTGAKHTIGHEHRSAIFTENYLKRRKTYLHRLAEMDPIIACTRIGTVVEQLPFPNAASRFLGQCVGTSDLLAQMADRVYLEKLLLLHREFTEAGIPGFDTETDLLKKTAAFYERTALARLKTDLGEVMRFSRLHFRARWALDQDLYASGMAKNIVYLQRILSDSNGSYRDKLRRGGILQRIAKLT